MDKYLPKYLYEVFINPNADSAIGFIFTIVPWLLILIWLFLSIRMISNPKKHSYYRINSIPNVFVTLGLLGTFLGITFGLIHFDTSPDEIKGSIVILLSGLKSAFFTSITGILLSLFFGKKIRRLFAERRVEEPQSIEYDVLVEISTTLKSLCNNSINQTNGIKQLHSEAIKQTTATNNVSNKLDDFAQNLSEYNAQAIVDALQGVIMDFNDTFKNFIAQLVDKNFEKLTESINQLISWQIQYKTEITTIKESYESLVSKHNEFVNTTEGWVKNLDEIAGRSSALAEIVRDFKSVFNEESNFSNLIHQIENSVTNLEESTKNISMVSGKIEEATIAFSSTKNEISVWLDREDGVRDSVLTLSDALTELRKFDISTIEKLDESFYTRLANTFKQLDTLMERYIKDLENRK